MFTPKELKEIKFDKAVFGGYDVEDVDKILASVTEDYATLFKENTMLKKKLKLLADTVEDYRSVDEAMRKALITAQNMANEMVAEAETKCAEMLANASDNAKAKVSELSSLVEAEENKLADAKAKTAAFVDNMLAMFASESEKFTALKNAVEVPVKENAPVVEEPNSADSRFDTLDQISKSLEEKVKLEDEEIRRITETAETSVEEDDEDADMKKASDTISFETEAPTEEEMDALEEAAKRKNRRRVEFSELKFGKDYDIKNDK